MPLRFEGLGHAVEDDTLNVDLLLSQLDWSQLDQLLGRVIHELGRKKATRPKPVEVDHSSDDEWDAIFRRINNRPW